MVIDGMNNIKQMNKTKMPILFIGHGAPNIILQNDPVLALWKEQVSNVLTPTAILVISSHWETHKITIGGNTEQKTIHDFSGFEKRLHQFQYRAPSACQLAQSIGEKLCIDIDHKRGLDHGSWVPLSVMYPDENIPVVQLSVSPNLSLAEHYQLGAKLSYLREQGILIIASGVIVHNLSLLNWQDKYAPPQPWAAAFFNDFNKAVMGKEFAVLTNPYRFIDAVKALPSIEHYLPFLIALGASENSTITSFANYWRFSNLSMHSYRFE